MKFKREIILFLGCFINISITAQIAVTTLGKASSAIVVNRNSQVDLQAADLLQDFIERISGAKLIIKGPTEKIKKGDFLIGDFQLPVLGIISGSIKKDGFTIATNDGYIRIVGGEGNGTIYGVITLLEQFCGVQYFAANEYTFPAIKSIMLPSSIHLSENPSFQYRQTQAYSLADPIYKLWHRLEEPKEVFASNLWVHTFNKILPATEFGEKHPEYYSLINGIRRPGAASQWCLTNTDLFEIVSHRIDSIFRTNPDKNIISVSQNDGNNTNCTCDKCKAIDDAEGGPSGSLIWFLNKLAQRFPDKQFSTLAYLYSVSPPKNIKPLPNVNIMLCDIDCMREVSLPENASGKSFLADIKGWARISENIFVWDYGINFDNYVSPFPNFHILQPNMQLFQKYNASMHFSQIGGSKGGDFSELRSYLVAKLLWNTNVNVDSVIKVFLHGYYGTAAPYLYQYIKMQEGAIMAGKAPLWIYDTPVSHKEGLLSNALMKRYNILFDEAEKSVSGDKTFSERVFRTRLSLQYASLEIARTLPVENKEQLKSELNLFKKRASELGVSNLNERRNTIDEYCELYLKRNLNNNKSIAYGSKVNYTNAPAPNYISISQTALTDGLYGGATFNESWLGWEGKDAGFIIDLGEQKDFISIGADFLHKLGSWIFLPKEIICYTSSDGIIYKEFGKKEVEEDQDAKVKFVDISIKADQKIKARYIKMNIKSIGLCPSWHYGVGHPAWFFLDEVSVL